MAFDRENFFKSCGHYGRGSAVADGFEALHAELAELKVACLVLKDRIAGIEGMVCDRPENAPDVPARETGWAVVNMPGVPGRGPRQFMTAWGFFPDCRDRKIMWFRSISDVESCVRALWDGGNEHVRPALLYKDTLEEVG